MIKLEVNGEIRVIRDSQIEYQTENDICFSYKMHAVSVSKQDTGGFYITAQHKENYSYAVSGHFGGEYCRYNAKTLEDCISIVLHNINLN